jgi:hypothetical protein
MSSTDLRYTMTRALHNTIYGLADRRPDQEDIMGTAFMITKILDTPSALARRIAEQISHKPDGPIGQGTLQKDIEVAVSGYGRDKEYNTYPLYMNALKASWNYACSFLEKEPIYRVYILDNGEVHCACYEMLDNFSPELDSQYKSIDDLPKWVQDRVSVLMLCDHTKPCNFIDGVGRRITEHIFWVVKGDKRD